MTINFEFVATVRKECNVKSYMTRNSILLGFYEQSKNCILLLNVKAYYAD